MEQHKNSSTCKIDRRLLYIKALNSAFFGGSGCLLPFIPVYMKQLGLTSTETGLIYGIMPFVTFFASPLFGMLADKTRKHKLVMTTCFIIIGLFYNLLLLVPDRQIKQIKTGSSIIMLRCGQPGILLWNYDTVIDSKKQALGGEDRCNIEIADLLNTTDANRNETIHFICKASDNSRNYETICLVNKHQSDETKSVLDVSKENKTLLFTVNRKHISSLNGSGNLVQLNTNVCDVYTVHEFEYNTRIFSSLNCSIVTDYDCELTYTHDNKNADCGLEVHKSSSTFYLFFLIFLVASVVQASMVSMMDSLVYSCLGEERRSDYGKQRMWGTIAYIITAPLSSTLMDMTSSSRTEANFQWSFHAYFVFLAIAALIVHFVQAKEIKSNNFFKNVTQLFKYPEIVVFLVINMFIGLLSVLFQVFLFLYLKNLNSPQTVLGLALVANCIPETIMMKFAGKLIKKIGCVSCLYIALMTLALRYFAYSLLTNPWYVLLIEPLHAFNYGLMHAAATTYASEMAPKGMSATMQGIRGGFMSGLGKGIGGLVTGKLFDPSGLGAVWTFRLYAIVCVLVTIIYAVIQNVFFRKGKAGEKETDSDTIKDQQASENLMTPDRQTENGLTEKP